MNSSRLAPLAFLLMASLAAGCGRSPDDRTDSAGGSGTEALIRIDGSSTVFPITEAVAEEFQRAHRDAKVTVGISGTGGGFQKFCRGEIDIADASRPVKDVEQRACAKGGVEFVELPIAYDGIAIVINPGNTWVKALTVADLKRIWEPSAQGAISRWSQVRAGWPDREIHLFGPGVDSGTFDYFTEVIVGKSGASRGDYTSSEDDNTLVQGVRSDELALGYFGFAYFEENTDKLKAIPVDDGNASNGDGPVAPSVDTIRNGTYAPLSRPVFIYVNKKALGRPALQTFVTFYLQNVAELSRSVGYVPLAEREYDLVRQRLDKGAIGTIFSGHAEPGVSLEQRLNDGAP
jgi:phosphate transport system substrate-binding protein